MEFLIWSSSSPSIHIKTGACQKVGETVEKDDILLILILMVIFNLLLKCFCQHGCIQKSLKLMIIYFLSARTSTKKLKKLFPNTDNLHYYHWFISTYQCIKVYKKLLKIWHYHHFQHGRVRKSRRNSRRRRQSVGKSSDDDQEWLRPTNTLINTNANTNTNTNTDDDQEWLWPTNTNTECWPGP